MYIVTIAIVAILAEETLQARKYPFRFYQMSVWSH